jgi:hypothetical protein
MFASSFTAFFPEFSARGFPLGFFLFFGRWISLFSAIAFRLLPLASAAVVCIFRARGV